MKKFATCLSFLILAISAHAENSDCVACQCTPDSECPCMSMPECINQEGTCTPEAHCGCYNTPTCDCSQCTTCTVPQEGTCCIGGGCCAPSR